MDRRRRYRPEEWHDFGKRLLARKGGDEQKEFLQVCLDHNDFLKYMDERLPLAGLAGEFALGNFDYRFTENEFREPPLDTQRRIWEAFELNEDLGQEETYADVCFWGMVVREMVENDLLEVPWLAAKRDDTQEGDGIFSIESALDEDADVEVVDKCVRRVLRSMCHPGPRGKRIVFDDFTLGKSWWRWCWASRMSQFLGLDRDDILGKILTGANYGVIAAKMHSGRSYLSPKNVFGGLILFLKDHGESQLPQKVLGKIVDQLAYQSAWRAIELRPVNENRNEIVKIHLALTDT